MGTIHRWRWGAAIQLFLDHEASPSRAAVVERHVADCADCESEMELFRRMKAALARLGNAEDVDPAVTRLRSHATRFSV